MFVSTVVVMVDYFANSTTTCLFILVTSLQAREKNSNLHPTEEGGDNGTWIDRSSYILLRNHGKYGKYYDKKMRDCVIMRVLERGRLMP